MSQCITLTFPFLLFWHLFQPAWMSIKQRCSNSHLDYCSTGLHLFVSVWVCNLIWEKAISMIVSIEWLLQMLKRVLCSCCCCLFCIKKGYIRKLTTNGFIRVLFLDASAAACSPYQKIPKRKETLLLNTYCPVIETNDDLYPNLNWFTINLVCIENISDYLQYNLLKSQKMIVCLVHIMLLV